MKNIYSYELEEYLISAALKGITDHTVKTEVSEDGQVSITITNSSDDAFECKYDVFGNVLLTNMDFQMTEVPRG